MLNDPNILKLIDLAINEDLKNGDITTNSIITTDEKKTAAFIAKQEGIIAGLDIAKMVFEKFDKEIKWTNLKYDRDTCLKYEKIVLVEGNYKALLGAERTALNFLQRLSGIATKTNRFVKQIEGFKTKILDTRKTIPGHRILDKYAVKMGGGKNHRMGLFDMVMIKDNHIKLAGSITSAVMTVKKNLPDSMKIEVEASTLDDVKEALNFNIDFIMLDNMSIDDMRKAVALCNGKILTEASGNVTINNIRHIAETGVDFISVGELTHSVEALDISMKIIN